VKNSFEKVWHDDLKVSAGSGNPLDEGGHGEYVYLRSSHTTSRADAIITVAATVWSQPTKTATTCSMNRGNA
jgi:hypothetical protein